MKSRRFLALTAAAAAVLACREVYAATEEFNAGTEWATSGDWSVGRVPTSTDNIVIDSGSPIGGAYTLTATALTVEDVSFTLLTSTTLANTSATASSITFNGGRGSSVPLIEQGSASNLTFTGTVGNPLNLVLGTSGIFDISNGGNLSISGNISETGGSQSLTFTNAGGAGAGTATLSGTDSFSGGLVAAGGEVDVTSDASLGAAGGSVTINGGRLGFTTNNVVIDPTRAIYLGANPSGSNTGSSLSIAGSILVTYAGTIQDLNGNTHGDLVKQGSGTLLLGGANSYSGNTFLNSGTTQLITGGSLPSTTVLSLGQSNSANLGTFNLNGINQTVAGLASILGTNSSSSSNTVTSSSAATLTINTGSSFHSYGSSSSTNSGIITGNLALVKTGTGTQVLGGSDTYGGGTLVSVGTLVGTSTSALGTNSGLHVANGATFAYQPTAAGALTIGSGVLDLDGGSTIGAAVGGTASQSAITSTGAAATSSPGIVTVNVYGIPGVAVPSGTTTNTLISAGNGLSADTYALGKIYNATDFTVGSLTPSSTAVSLNVTLQTAQTTEYWKGGFSGGNNVWAISNGLATGGASNWTTDSGGADATSLVPGTTATVSFSAAGESNEGSMVLGANMSIAALVDSDTNALTLNADGNTLKITGSSTTGITLNSGSGGLSIAAPVTVPGTQLWTNNSANALTISGAVVTTGLSMNNLNVAGSGNVNISGAIGGIEALSHSGAGTLTLSGPNTISGSTTVANGTLTYGGSGSSSGEGNLVVAGMVGNSAVVNFNSTGVLTFNVTTIGGTSESGAINQTSGTVNVVVGSTSYMEIGGGAGGYGSYALAGGVLNTNNSSTSNTSSFRVGDGGAPGVFTQTGGTANIYRNAVIGGNDGITTAANVGVVTITGGTFNTSSGYTIIIGDASGATGTLNVGTAAGGSGLVVANDGTTQATSAIGILNLNAGTLRVCGGTIAGGGTNFYVNLNGGTLQAGGTGLTLINTSPTAVRVYNGGAIVDTQGNAATISAPLVTTTGDGVYIPTTGTIPISSGGGAGYIGAPVVTVSGGGGTGATAVANISGGVVTGVTLTSPGQGYTAGQALTFAFAGGGATTPAGSFVYTLQGVGTDLAANGTGGVTKIGSGTLALTGANSYAGGTLISAGMLLADSTDTVSGSVGSGLLTVGASGTLGGTGQIRSSVTVNGTITAGSSATAGAPGTLTANASGQTTTLAGGGTYSVKIDSASTGGAAGTSWDEIVLSGLAVGATSGSPFNVSLVSLTSGNVAGAAQNFSPATSDTWVVGTTTATSISGITLAGSGPTILATDGTPSAPPITTGDSGIFTLNTSAFASANGTSASTGDYALELVGTSGNYSFDVVYTATPEPRPALLAFAGVTPILGLRRRRRNALIR